MRLVAAAAMVGVTIPIAEATTAISTGSQRLSVNLLPLRPAAVTQRVNYMQRF